MHLWHGGFLCVVHLDRWLPIHALLVPVPTVVGQWHNLREEMSHFFWWQLHASLVGSPAGAEGGDGGGGSFLLQSSLSALTLITVSLQPLYYHSSTKKILVILPKGQENRLQLNTQTLLTQRCRTWLTMLSRHSVETYRETSSHESRQGTLVRSRLSSPSHCGLILGL